MTNTEQAQKTMFAALKKELEDDSAAYSGNQDYEDEVTAFLTALVDHETKAAAAHADNSGFSADKLKQKIVLADLASNLSGKAYVKFVNIDRLDLAEQMHTEPTDYKQPADSQCATLAQAAHKVMNDNLTLLSPNTITAAMLTDLKNETDKFVALQGTSETEHEVSPALTKAFKDSFKPVMLRVAHLKYLTRDYKTSNPGFYNRLMASTVIPVINVHHTYVEVHATGKMSGHAVEGMTFSLSNSTKTAVSDWQGYATLAEVRNGEAVLKGEIGGVVKYEAHIVIKRGTTNKFEAKIEEE